MNLIRLPWNKYTVSFLCFVNVALLFYSATRLSIRDHVVSQPTIRYYQLDKGDTSKIANEVAEIRNNLSRQLNEMSKQVGQMQCEAKRSGVNEHGGWCKHLSLESTGEHKTDKKILPALSKFLKGKRVGSFGDGPGAYKREFLKLGEVALYDSYDGAPFCEETSEGRVKFLDLTIPQYGIPIYDWVMSLEVAEHIPPKYENIYLDNIFRHAKEGIILSWAVPGQGGVSHVNNKPLSYVIDVMEKNGFAHDKENSLMLRKQASFWWLEKNINVYRRKNFAKFQNESILSQYYV